MSVIIKGMDMPENCWKCKLRLTSFDSVHNRVLNACIITRKEVTSIKLGVNCPLTEVPTPHGRLIDAKYQGLLCFAPTVIEAEE